MLAGFVQRTDNVGGCTGGRYADNRILVRNIAFYQFFPAALHVVFRIFHGIAQGSVSAGYQTDNQGRRHAECRWYFGGVEYAEAAACAGAHIENASALFHAGYDLCH